MARVRIAALAAVCVLAGAVVGDLTLGGSRVPASAAVPETAGISSEVPEQVVEDWSDAEDWSRTGVSIVDGRVRGYGAEVAGAFRALDSSAGPDLFLRGSLTVVPGDAGGMVGIGVSTALPGARPSAAELISIGVDPAGRPAAYQGKGTGGAGEKVLDDAPLPAGRYWVTVSGSADGLGLVLTSADGAREWRWAVPVAKLDGPVANVAVWNADDRGVSGSAIRTLGYRQSATPLTPVADLVSRAPIVVWGWGAGVRERVSLPGDYDPARPVPLVMFAHGSRNDENSVVRSPVSELYVGLLDAGYAVASSSQHGTSWGNDASVRDLEALYRSVDDRFPVDGDVFLLAESMGGLSTLTFAAEGRVPVAAWAGVYPVVDLHAAWMGTRLHHGDIAAAYDLAPGGTDYDLRTAGSDPILLDPSSFDGLAMRFYASWQDTVVPARKHSLALIRRVAEHASEAALVTHTGDHGDPSAFQPADLVEFFDRNR